MCLIRVPTVIIRDWIPTQCTLSGERNESKTEGVVCTMPARLLYRLDCMVCFSVKSVGKYLVGTWKNISGCRIPVYREGNTLNNMIHVHIQAVSMS